MYRGVGMWLGVGCKEYDTVYRGVGMWVGVGCKEYDTVYRGVGGCGVQGIQYCV